MILIYAGRPAELMPSRVNQMEDLIRGPGGLIACTAGVTIPPPVTRIGSNCYQAAVGDDPLMFLLVPPISRATGIPVQEIMKWTAIASLAAVMLALPFLLGRAWLLAPVVLLADPLRIFDLYWFAPVAYLAAFPLLLQWRWDRRWLIVVAVAAGVLSGFRSGTGLPIVASSLVVGWQRPRKSTVAWAIVVVLAYLIPGWILPDTARFWHSIYIGLGYLPNPYVAGYADEVGIATVARVAPGTPYQSHAYEVVLRDEVLRIALADPGFIFQSVLAKIAAIGPALIVGALAIVALGRRRAALAPALLLAAIPAVLTVPNARYLIGFNILILLALIVFAPRVHDLLRGRPTAVAQQ